MKKNFLLVVLYVLNIACLFTAAGLGYASGWRIPEQSIDSTAKAGANIASACHGDTAYFNPAKMGWLENSWQVEGNLTHIHLTSVSYDDHRPLPFDHDSEEEYFFVPTGFLVSPDYSGMRFGLSIAAPYGLGKRWEKGYGTAFVKEFSLRVIEVNPTISYSFRDTLGIAAGPRVLFAHGVVESDASVIGRNISRSMVGDTTELGWNAAVYVKPAQKFDIAATYRSYVSLDFTEQTELHLLGNSFSPDASISIPAPAVFALAASYDVADNVNIELSLDRTFWSEYEKFDFDFHQSIRGNPFEKAVPRNWEDSNAIRLGLTWQTNTRLTLMGGFAYDQTPVPDMTMDFSVPDADAWIYSFGMRYKITENLEAGISMLYDYKEERDIHNTPQSPVYGSFTDTAAILISSGITFTF